MVHGPTPARGSQPSSSTPCLALLGQPILKQLLLLAVGQQPGIVNRRLDRLIVTVELATADAFGQLLANRLAFPILGQEGLLEVVDEDPL